MKIDNQNILSRGRIISQRTRPQDQTAEEWSVGWERRDREIKANRIRKPLNSDSANLPEQNTREVPEQAHQGLVYRYQGYLTRKDARGKGRLILELRDADTGEIFQCLFNANITYQRGQHKGEYFKTGRGGRFWVYPRSKFAAFWIQSIGQPDRWSTLYRNMSHLKELTFSGDIRIAETYRHLVDIRKAQI